MDYFDKEEVFHTPERPRTKLDDKACKYIEDCLERNRQKIAEGNRKQCMDLTRVWQVLREDMGYDMCYATVTAYAREYAARREPAKSRECFIRQYHPAGEECQFDWGDVKLKIHGWRLTVRMTVFTLPTVTTARLISFSGRIRWPSWNLTATTSTTLAAFLRGWSMTT